MRIEKRARSSDVGTKQLRVYLVAKADSIFNTDEQDFHLSNGGSDSHFAADTAQFISNCMKGKITILPHSKQPLISITLCQIFDGETDPGMDVLTNPLLRSCVKRLFVGKRVLRSDEHLRTTLSVEVPSQHEKKALLRYQVTTTQTSNSHSVSTDDAAQLTQHVILPSTRIIFQHPTNTQKRQNIDQDTEQFTMSKLKVLEAYSSLHSNLKGLLPHQHLLQSLQSLVMFDGSTDSLMPPILRAFLLSGPPGVGKTFAVKQAIAIANSWLDPTPTTSEHIQLVSIRGSELLALTTEGGSHASSARELEKHFRMAANMCDGGSTKAAVVFLDECDALVSSSTVTAAMLAMLLDMMESNFLGWNKLLVVAATNRVDAIPAFLRRPGRLEKEVVVSPPDVDERFSLLKDMLAKNDDRASDFTAKITDEDLKGLAESCVGYVAADLAALVRRAAILSMERLCYDCTNDQMDLTSSPSISISDLTSATNDVGASCLRDATLSAPPKTTWSDIAGDCGGAKFALRQAIEWPRTRKDAFKALGLSPPRGVLLHGPPGCAKTTLARAAAGSAGVAFLSLSPADVYSSSFVGEAESVVRRAFDLARSAAPCVLFFDEIDSIIGGGDEGSDKHGMGRGSSAEARVLSTFLNEMDVSCPYHLFLFCNIGSQLSLYLSRVSMGQ